MYLRATTERENNQNLRCCRMNENRLQCMRKVTTAMVATVTAEPKSINTTKGKVVLDDIIGFLCDKHKAFLKVSEPSVEER